MTFSFYKKTDSTLSRTFDIIGDNKNNRFLFTVGRSVPEAIDYILKGYGWPKDHNVGEFQFSISSETHPEYFI